MIYRFCFLLAKESSGVHFCFSHFAQLQEKSIIKASFKLTHKFICLYVIFFSQLVFIGESVMNFTSTVLNNTCFLRIFKELNPCGRHVVYRYNERVSKGRNMVKTHTLPCHTIDCQHNCRVFFFFFFFREPSWCKFLATHGVQQL